MEEWVAFMRDTKRRRVGLDEFGRVTVSTVFADMGHGLGREWQGPPPVFETMVFLDMSGSELGFGAVECVRYATREAALEGHRQIVERWRLEWDI